MICLDEVKATIARLKIIHDNCEDQDEQVLSQILFMNINQMLSQFEQLKNSPQWEEIKKQYLEGTKE